MVMREVLLFRKLRDLSRTTVFVFAFNYSPESHLKSVEDL